MQRFGPSVVAVCAILVTLLMPAQLAAQETSWLDGDLASWNAAGMAIPTAPEIEGNPDPRCSERERPDETDEDSALTAERWRLFLPYERGWGVTLVSALAGYDGMCRPLGFQYFVFVDGVFAGTIAPEPMASRTDGSADTVDLWFADQLSAEFRRYAANDPLCCPSGSTTVAYTIATTPAGPVLNPVPAS